MQVTDNFARLRIKPAEPVGFSTDPQDALVVFENRPDCLMT